MEIFENNNGAEGSNNKSSYNEAVKTFIEPNDAHVVPRVVPPPGYALHYVPSNALIMHLQKYLHFIKSAKSAHSPVFLPLQNFLIIYIYAS